MARRTNPDDFESPVPHEAPDKSTVDAVLDRLVATGNSVVSLVAGLLAAVLVLYSGYVIYDSFNTQRQAFSSAWDLLKFKPEFIEDYETPLTGSALYEINHDYRAWLTVYDTTIDYPVMQGQNDLYYAAHDIYKQSSLTGAIYLAAGNSPDLSDSYNLIYGHHMDNGAMFGRLDDYRDGAYWNAHRTGILVTMGGVFDIEFFAVAETDAYEGRIYSVGDKRDQVISFLESGGDSGAPVGNRVPTRVLHYDAAVAASATKVVALSTCASATTSGRLVVFGKMTPRKMELKYYNLRVKYLLGDEEIFPTEEYTYPAGQAYSVVSPALAGYTPDKKDVSGLLYKDTEIIVRYVKNQYTLTVRYVNEAGEEIAPPYTGAYDAGQAYRVPSPEVEGYQTGQPLVSGTMPVQDETVTVVYTPVVRLTVKYLLDGEEIFPDRTGVYARGTEYNVVSPTKAGYVPDLATVSGKLTEDTVVVVNYTRQAYRLTVRFVTMDGVEVADSYNGTYLVNDEYDVSCPAVPGYKSVRVRVTGVMGARDEIITVIYLPIDDEREIVNTTSIGDYETPLGLGHINVQIGVCFE